MMAAQERRISAERRTAMVDILLKANVDLNTQENVRYQYQNMHSNLMQLHVPHIYTITDTLSSQSTGWTALMFAVNECHKDIVQRLVSAGADVHIRDKVCGDMDSVCQMLHVVPNGLGKSVCTILL